MFGRNAGKRLVHQYEVAFRNGRQKVLEERKMHIDVLKTAIMDLEEQSDELLDELNFWTQKAGVFSHREELSSKWKVISRLLMFFIGKDAERNYNKALKKINEADSNKEKLEGFLQQIM